MLLAENPDFQVSHKKIIFSKTCDRILKIIDVIKFYIFSLLQNSSLMSIARSITESATIKKVPV